MPVGDLATYTLPKNTRVYVDTSALISAALLIAKREGKPVPTREERRGEKVVAFAARATRSEAVLVTTMLAVEEVASSTRNKYRTQAAKKHGRSSWWDLKTADPGAATAEDKIAHAAMMKTVKDALGQMGQLGIQLDEVDAKGGSSTDLALSIQKQWLRLIRDHERVDAMDALHICTGVVLGARHFITFDAGWESVPQIFVLK